MSERDYLSTSQRARNQQQTVVEEGGCDKPIIKVAPLRSEGQHLGMVLEQYT